MQGNLEIVKELLYNSKSSKREAGAKKARKLRLDTIGNALLEVLYKEVEDKRTWSVQYQLIIALGVTESYQSLPFLWSLTKRDFQASIIYQALGNAITRLSVAEQGVADTFERIFETDDARIIKGAFRALAVLELLPDDKTIEKIISYATSFDNEYSLQGYPNDRTGLRYWVVIACAKWKKELTADFLNDCKCMGDDSLKSAVEDSIKGKSIKYDF